MSLRKMDFPYPILKNGSLDYINCYLDFRLYEDKQPIIQGKNIIIETEYDISCPSIQKLIDNKQAKAILVAESPFASFRKIFDFDINKKITIKIDKNKVIKNINLMLQIVANKGISTFSLPEHNKEFFGDLTFSLKKGDIIALSEEIIVRLDASELEKPLSSVITVSHISEIEYMHIDFNSDKIKVVLKSEIYYKYYDSKRYNNGTFNKVVTSMLFLPVITEAISNVKGFLEHDEEFESSLELKWVKSIINRANKLGINLQEEQGMVIVANKILGDLLDNSIDSLDSIINNISNNADIIEEGGID